MALTAAATAHLAAPLPANEPKRLQALAAYGILDTPFEAAFDDITRIASQICVAPIAVVNLIDQGRQWFKAEIGLGVRETPIDTSICAHAILQPFLFEIPDTQLDTRFACNPLVTGDPHLRFYAGAPLITPDGHNLGTVCVLDRQPRRLSEGQREALLALARQTMALMELRRTLRDAEAVQSHLRRIMVTAGHDLRQPLQTISANLEIARLQAADAQAVATHASRGLVAAKALGKELDELARASFAASSLVRPEQTPLALQGVFDDLEKTWRAPAERKGLKLRFARTGARVTTNARLLDTILGNLIGNAIKYTERGGVLIGCRRYRQGLRIDIIDTGVGIAQEQQPAMFDAFRKADLRSEGLGLGLSIVRSTSALLGAELSMRSTPGSGTAISVLLA